MRDLHTTTEADAAVVERHRGYTSRHEERYGADAPTRAEAEES